MDLLDASQRPFYLLYCIQRWLALVIDLLVAALVFILVALIVTFRHRADAGFVGVALINIMSFNITLSVLIQHYTAVETSLGAISRIQSFVASTASENLPQESQAVPSEWPSEGHITISNLSATYSRDRDPALHHVNLAIPAGQKLGICGASGSGKSSFVATLFHLLEITEGTVIVDGIDISTIPRSMLRERLTVIPQDPVFLNGTVRQNLDPLHRAGAEAAKTVLEKVGLWRIVSLAGGLDVQMNAEEMLSHGQRQLFCLARALLRKSKVVVMDEVSASVDLVTEGTVMEVIEREFAGCTVIAVAHRLGSIRGYDRIAVFENGRIVEVGAPGELLVVDRGKFRELWEAGGV